MAIDSREGGPEESEEVEDGAGEGGRDSSFSGAPLPKHLGQASGNHWGIASGQGTHLMILSSAGLSMPIVLVRVIKHFWVVQSPQSLPWTSANFCHNF